MTSPSLATSRADLAEQLLARSEERPASVALVPTMGALHEGHASLMRAARERAEHGTVVASVFVNPMQFGAGEDLDRYPRMLETDVEMCAREGVDIVFAPPVEEVYPGWPEPPRVTVRPGPDAKILEGKLRKGHFRGVLTVVAKLFGLVAPDVAMFGEKDYQQLVLIRQMVADLCLPVEIDGVPTVREPDGLALSSRNRFLDEDQRIEAAIIHRALVAAQESAVYGAEPALHAARAEMRSAKAVDLDYLVLTDPELQELPDEVPDGTEARLLIAARVGATRLIDNAPITLGRTA